MTHVNDQKNSSLHISNTLFILGSIVFHLPKLLKNRMEAKLIFAKTEMKFR